MSLKKQALVIVSYPRGILEGIPDMLFARDTGIAHSTSNPSILSFPLCIESGEGEPAEVSFSQKLRGMLDAIEYCTPEKAEKMQKEYPKLIASFRFERMEPMEVESEEFSKVWYLKVTPETLELLVPFLTPLGFVILHGEYVTKIGIKPDLGEPEPDTFNQMETPNFHLLKQVLARVTLLAAA